MRVAGQLSLLVVLLLSLFMTDATRVSACSCDSQPLFGELAAASAVFVGTVTQVHEPIGPNADGLLLGLVTLDVSQHWKGPSNTTLTVANFIGCEYQFAVGEAYLIFANRADGLLYTSLCNRNRPLAQATEEIAHLDTIFSPHPDLAYQPSAVISVRGHSRYPTMADRIHIRFLFSQPQPTATPSEAQQTRLIETLAANRAPEAMLTAGTFYGDRDGFYFTVNQADIANNDTAAFLDLLYQTQLDFVADEQIAIGKVEVMFSVQDCFRHLAEAQRQALINARWRAELLANGIGGRLGDIVSVSDTSVTPVLSKGEFMLCDSIRASRWYRLPLRADLQTASALDTHVTVSVTYALEPAVSGVQPPIEQLRNMPSTPTAVAPSPLPTPTHR